jgi:hypothetical protein
MPGKFLLIWMWRRRRIRQGVGEFLCRSAPGLPRQGSVFLAAYPGLISYPAARLFCEKRRASEQPGLTSVAPTALGAWADVDNDLVGWHKVGE